MIEAILVVLTNPVAGREDDFNDWYTNIHLRDAMRFRGSIATQRFSFASQQVQDFPQGFVAKYLALYEVYDAARFSQEHVDNALTPRMVVEDSIDMSRMDDFHYYPLVFRDKAPRTAARHSVVLEQIRAKPGEEAAFQHWYSETYLPERMRDAGVSSAALLQFLPHGQLVDFMPEHDHVGIYRLSNDEARDGWQQGRQLRESPLVDASRLAITCWDVMTPRITEDDIHHTTAKALAAEEAARLRVGDRQHRDRGDHLRPS